MTGEEDDVGTISISRFVQIDPMIFIWEVDMQSPKRDVILKSTSQPALRTSGTSGIESALRAEDFPVCGILMVIIDFWIETSQTILEGLQDDNTVSILGPWCTDVPVWFVCSQEEHTTCRKKDALASLALTEH